MCFQYIYNVLLLEGWHLYLYCSSFVCLLTVLLNTCCCREGVWAARVWLKQVLMGGWKRASRHIWCAVHSQHYLHLVLPSIIGYNFFHETLSFISYYFLYEMVIFALRIVQYHSRGVSRSQLPKWHRLAMWLHCPLSVDNCAEEWLPIALPFPGMMETWSWLKTCSPVMTGNTGKKATDFETLSCETAWQVAPLNWTHFWQHIVCFPHFCRMGKEEGSCFH